MTSRGGPGGPRGTRGAATILTVHAISGLQFPPPNFQHVDVPMAFLPPALFLPSWSISSKKSRTTPVFLLTPKRKPPGTKQARKASKVRRSRLKNVAPPSEAFRLTSTCRFLVCQRILLRNQKPLDSHESRNHLHNHSLSSARDVQDPLDAALVH